MFDFHNKSHPAVSRFHTAKPIYNAGFSLIEMMVAVALFAVVMLISTSALLSLIDATHKAQALQSVMNNLNVALDGMVRSIRTGNTYHCGNLGVYTDPRDCSSGDTLIAFEAFGGNSSSAADQRVYWYNENDNRLYKSEDSGISWLPVTAPEVLLEEMRFYVTGTVASDDEQPKVVISVRGSAGNEKGKTRTTFSIQATAVQRILDL